jgi:hypothetical protein
MPARLRLRRSLAAATAAGALLLAGCPFSSDQPLVDPATASIDAALLGSWTAVDPETGGTQRATWLDFDGRQLALVVVAPDGELSAFRVVTAVVGGRGFMSVRELGSDDDSWYLVHYDMEGTRLTQRVVEDTLFAGRAFGSPRDLADFLAAHVDDPRLYADASEPDMAWEREKTGAR